MLEKWITKQNLIVPVEENRNRSVPDEENRNMEVSNMVPTKKQRNMDVHINEYRRKKVPANV